MPFDRTPLTVGVRAAHCLCSMQVSVGFHANTQQTGKCKDVPLSEPKASHTSSDSGAAWYCIENTYSARSN